jgi:hypothetical protein
LVAAPPTKAPEDDAVDPVAVLTRLLADPTVDPQTKASLQSILNDPSSTAAFGACLNQSRLPPTAIGAAIGALLFGLGGALVGGGLGYVVGSQVNLVICLVQSPALTAPPVSSLSTAPPPPASG